MYSLIPKDKPSECIYYIFHCTVQIESVKFDTNFPNFLICQLQELK